MKIKVFLILFLIVLFWPINPAFAIIKTDGDLRVTFGDPLFGSSVVWYPGLEKSEEIKVENIGLNSHDVLMQAINTSQTGNIANQYRVKIVQDGNVLWGWDTMQHFWDLGEHEYGSIPKAQWKTYYLFVSLPAEVGNEFQSKSAKFDLKIGFKGEAGSVTNSVTNNGVPAGVGIGGVGGSTLGEVMGDSDNIGSGSATISAGISPEERILSVNSNQGFLWWLIGLLGFLGFLLLLILLYRRRKKQ